jgi:hypothetical protein
MAGDDAGMMKESPRGSLFFAIIIHLEKERIIES